jgi:hypothetical protein
MQLPAPQKCAAQSGFSTSAARTCPASQVLGEDLKLVVGQQHRLMRGSNTWITPVSYDKVGVGVRGGGGGLGSMNQGQGCVVSQNGSILVLVLRGGLGRCSRPRLHPAVGLPPQLGVRYRRWRNAVAAGAAPSGARGQGSAAGGLDLGSGGAGGGGGGGMMSAGQLFAAEDAESLAGEDGDGAAAAEGFADDIELAAAAAIGGPQTRPRLDGGAGAAA